MPKLYRRVANTKNFLQTILCSLIGLIFTGTTIASVIRNTHSRTEVLHRYLPQKVNKVDTLDLEGEVNSMHCTVDYHNAAA